MKFRHVGLFACLLVLATGSLRAADSVAQVLARARAYLGTESALNAVQTVHFTGTLSAVARVPSPDDKTKTVDQPVSLPVDIVFQKPLQQRITLTKTDSIDSTVLDDYDGWSRSVNPKNPSQWRVTLLDARQIKALRANTWENLAFFAGIEKIGGNVQSDGDVTVDGIACAKLSFVHADGIVFIRYFDKASGRLVKTETDTGAEIREEGQVTVNGVRFPKKVINKSANGTTSSIVFDQVTVNVTVPAGDFAVPAFKAN